MYLDQSMTYTRAHIDIQIRIECQFLSPGRWQRAIVSVCPSCLGTLKYTTANVPAWMLFSSVGTSGESLVQGKLRMQVQFLCCLPPAHGVSRSVLPVMNQKMPLHCFKSSLYITLPFFIKQKSHFLKSSEFTEMIKYQTKSNCYSTYVRKIVYYLQKFSE